MNEQITVEVLTTCIYMFGAVLGGVMSIYVLHKLIQLAKGLFAERLDI